MTASSEAGHQRGQQYFTGDRVSTGLLVTGGVTALTLAIAFGLLALDVEHFWAVFIVGFGGVLPTALGLVAAGWPDTGSDRNDTSANDAQTALEEIRLRYARGELTEAEFEHRVERLMDETPSKTSSR